MTFSFHPEASAEFEGAVAYYEELQAGLGLDLALEVQAAIGNVVSFPDAWPPIEGEIRRCLVRRSPYTRPIRFLSRVDHMLLPVA